MSGDRRTRWRHTGRFRPRWCRLVPDAHDHARQWPKDAGGVANLNRDGGVTLGENLRGGDHATELRDQRQRRNKGRLAERVDCARSARGGRDCEAAPKIVETIGNPLGQIEVERCEAGNATLVADLRIAVTKRPRRLDLQVRPRLGIVGHRVQHRCPDRRTVITGNGLDDKLKAGAALSL